MSDKAKLLVALGLVYIVWGSTFLGVKFAIQSLPPMFVAGLRFFAGGLFLSIFILIKNKKIPSLKQTRNAAFIGLLLSGIGNCAIAFSLQFLPSGLVALLAAMLPVWMILLDILFFSHQKPGIISLIGLSLGLVGMIYLLNPGKNLENREISLYPAFIVFIGSIAWAFGSLKSPYLELPKSLVSTAIQMFVGGCFSMIMSFIFEDNQIKALQNMPSQTYLALAYLIIIGSYVGYTAYVWLINNAPPQLTATYAYVNPIVALFLGWIFLDEKLSSRTIFASGIILVGVILMTLGRKKTSKVVDFENT